MRKSVRKRARAWLAAAADKLGRQVVAPDFALVVTPRFFCLLADYLLELRGLERITWDGHYQLHLSVSYRNRVMIVPCALCILPADDPRVPFYAAMEAAPDDDLPRLVFADWLDEHGDPLGAVLRRVVAARPTPRGRPGVPPGHLTGG